MLFNSEQFMIFLPIVLLVYYIFPKKIRYIWLLIASYYFYMCWNAKYVVLILGSTIVTYISGLIVAKMDKAYHKKIAVVICLVLNLAILFFFKYANFSLALLQDVFFMFDIQLNVPEFDILLPVGISFYTFQALSYTLDVYRGDIYPEKNFFRYALFVSFFPQLVAGPIERSKNLLKQLAVAQPFCFQNFREGVLLMIWGFFLKIVLADRVAIFVDTVYGNYSVYPGIYLIIATVLFAVQIYGDFYGYSVIAMGTAKIIGIDLMENFEAPYLSRTVAEFWRRWHISLTSWFKDYLYIPLGGNRKGKIRKYVNIVVVFLVSGLWHGANLTFVVWGGLNGLYQVIGQLFKPVRDKVNNCLHIDRETLSHRLLEVLCVFLLVDFSWIFFRANSLQESFDIIRSMATARNLWVLFDGSLYNCGLDSKNFSVMLISILLLVFADIFKYKRIQVRNIILKQEVWFRCIFFAVSIWLVLVFGIWGPSYDAANFIYFQF